MASQTIVVVGGGANVPALTNFFLVEATGGGKFGNSWMNKWGNFGGWEAIFMIKFVCLSFPAPKQQIKADYLGLWPFSPICFFV
jgi:hypothetical protein